MKNCVNLFFDNTPTTFLEAAQKLNLRNIMQSYV